MNSYLLRRRMAQPFETNLITESEWQSMLSHRPGGVYVKLIRNVGLVGAGEGAAWSPPVGSLIRGVLSVDSRSLSFTNPNSSLKWHLGIRPATTSYLLSDYLDGSLPMILFLKHFNRVDLTAESLVVGLAEESVGTKKFKVVLTSDSEPHYNCIVNWNGGQKIRAL